MTTIDLAIIGGGPAGYVAAERAGEKGLSVILFEKNKLGGVCLNEGCIPTKTLLYSAKVLDTAKNGAKYGISTENLTFDYLKIAKRKDKIVRKLVAGVKAKMRDNDVNVISGKAVINERNEEGIVISCNEEEYLAKDIIIATGSESFIPPIKGLNMESEYMLTNREILAKKELPESLTIIGGGVIGMEFASMYTSFGIKVSVIEMADKILGEMDDELSTMLQEIYANKGIDFLLNAKVTEINQQSVIYEKEGEKYEITNEAILVSVGRRPVIEGYGLENLNIDMFKGGIKVDKTMASSVPHVYAAGDVTGFSLLAHTASREGEVIVNNLTAKEDAMSYKAIPGVVYTNPEISGVGLSEKAAEAQGIKYQVAKLPMTYAGRFVAENEGDNGLCKVLINEERKVIGVHILGNPSSEIIFGACMAIEEGMTLEQLKKVVFPHPTVSEILKETIFTV